MGTIFETIPFEMRALPHWVLWRFETRDGKETKVPYQAKNPSVKAKSNDASTWCDFETALQAMSQADGIGFMAGVEPSGIILVDLDHCIEDGEIADWAREIAAICDSYVEVSPSGTGLHCFVKGKLPGPGGKFNDAEIYNQLRYFTVTGNPDPDFNRPFRTLADEETAKIYELCKARKPGKPAQLHEGAPTTENAARAPALSNDDLFRKMFRSKNGAKIQALWGGDTSAHDDDDSSADMALCAHLAFWTGKDAQKMDSMFRQSGLMRDKWNANSGGGITYGERTIEKAIAGCREVYSPAPSKKSDKTTIAAPKKSGRAGTDVIRARLYNIMQDKALTATERHRHIAAEVVTWLHGQGKFYQTARREFKEVMFFDEARKMLLPIQGDYFLGSMSEVLAVNRAERVFEFVHKGIENEGLSDRSALIEPEKFWARRPGFIYLSCGPGRMVRISASGVEMVDNGTDHVLFACDTLPEWQIVEPENPFNSCTLFRDIETTAPHGRVLFMLWAISLASDQKTKPPLCLTGAIGSGKTRLIKGLFELYGLDPRISAMWGRDGDKEFWTAVNCGGLTCFDNCDTRIDWLPDALAAAATAGIFEKRKLYTDEEKVTLRARAWIAITSANPTFAADPGLADRMLVVRLNRRKGETADSILSDEIAAIRNSGLSWIAHILSKALADEKPVPECLNSRHPDFAELAVRIGRAMGLEREAIAALRAAEADKSLISMENDSIGATLLEICKTEAFQGSAKELLARIVEADSAFTDRLNTKKLGKWLSKQWPHLVAVFHARENTDGHSKTKVYEFSPAGIAGFESGFAQNSLINSSTRTSSQNPLETPQTPQTAERVLETAMI